MVWSITKQFADGSLTVATSFLAESLSTPWAEKHFAQFRVYSLHIQMKKKMNLQQQTSQVINNETQLWCACYIWIQVMPFKMICDVQAAE